MFRRKKEIMIPVYLINGFLESGKTEFIKYTISQPYFQSKGTTLLILCEEGELEYEEALLKKTRTVMEVIEDEEDNAFGVYLNCFVDNYRVCKDREWSGFINIDPNAFIFSLYSNGRINYPMKFPIKKLKEGGYCLCSNAYNGLIEIGNIFLRKQNVDYKHSCCLFDTFDYHGIHGALCGSSNFAMKRFIVIQFK